MLAVHLLPDLPDQFLGSTCHAPVACHLLSAQAFGLHHPALGSLYVLELGHCPGSSTTPVPLVLFSGLEKCCNELSKA